MALLFSAKNIEKLLYMHACSIVINDNSTDIVVQKYSNRIFLIITQYKKFGTLLSVNREAAINQFNGTTFRIKTLFGKESLEIHAAARFIADHFETEKPLLMSIGLKDYESKTLKAIVAAIKEMKAFDDN
ncbi:proteasome assembly chaperone 3-like [Prorops nasuta]|uniref:proteasome assembly chaperone 3-like n=1 Tax=Prorops nasuta TaxID=863751 RepID=UPI0034CF069F